MNLFFVDGLKPNGSQGEDPYQAHSVFPKFSSAGEEIVSENFLLSKDLSDSLNLFAHQYKTDVFTVLFSAFNLLLHRHTNHEEICVSCTFESGDELNVMDDLKTSVNGDDSFISILDQIKKNIERTKVLQREALNKETHHHLFNPNQERNHLFPAVFIGLHKQEENEYDQHFSAILSEYKNEYRSAMVLGDSAKGIEGNFVYINTKIEAIAAKRIVGHYENLLHGIVQNPKEKTGAMNMLSKEEKEELLVKFNNTEKEYPYHKTIVDLFEEQVIKTPENIALVLGHEKLDYKTLNEKANKLARLLIDHGVQPADNIGLIADRGFDMIIGMYAIMKAGAAYVPIDPQYPVDRQEYIFHQSSIKLMIADGDYDLKKSLPENTFINISKTNSDKYSGENLYIKTDSKQLAYTIYTSGSTGRPKGVMIEHHSAVNLIQWVNNTFDVKESDRLLFITSMCFDLSVYDIFGILSTGGSIAIAKQEEINDVQKLPLLLKQYGITF